jgi:hypothetical protein
VLKKLVADENEFIFAAFDVFISDRDTEELLDSLSRAVHKSKQRQKPNLRIISAGQFYPNPRNSPPKSDVARNSNDTKVLNTIHNENLEDFLKPEEFGMLVEMIESNNEIVL